MGGLISPLNGWRAWIRERKVEDFKGGGVNTHTEETSARVLRPESPRAADTANATLERSMALKKIDLVFEQIEGIAAGSLLGALVLATILWGQVPAAHLYTWAAAVVCFIVVVPQYLKWQYRRARQDSQDPVYWSRRTTGAGVLSGLAWGAPGYFFFLPDFLEYQFILFVFMMMAAAAAMTTTVAHKPQFFVVVTAMLLPIAVRSAMEMDPLHLALSFTMLVYLSVLVYFHHNVHATLVESLKLRYQNLDLIRALTLKTEEAQRASLAKTRFLAAASHDLRQPLHAQALFVGELKARSSDSETRPILAYLEASMHSMREMFNRLLSISQLDAGAVQPALENFPVQLLLDRLRTEFAPLMEAKGLRLHVAPCHLTVRSDPALLERMLRNLLSNAVKYVHAGRVLLGCRRRERSLRIQVLDTGPGIPRAQLGLIFEEFYQLKNPERDRDKGMGLGLAIVKRLADLLGHPVHVASTLHAGTAFSLDVPLTDDAPTAAAREEPEPNGAHGLNGISVCVIDDDIMVSTALRRLLTAWGCKTVVAASGDEAVAGLAPWDHPPDVIIADYRLRQGQTGTDAIGQIQRKYNSAVPALLVTGDTAPERIQDALASGYRLLHKPVDPELLYRVLGDLVRAPATPA